MTIDDRILRESNIDATIANGLSFLRFRFRLLLLFSFRAYILV